MLRNILLLLEPTPAGQVAQAVACGIASRGDCRVTALQVHDGDWKVDSKELYQSARAALADSVRKRLNGQATSDDDALPPDGALDEAALSRLGIYWQERTLSGPKFSVLSDEAERNDLTVIGRAGNFGEQWSHDAKDLINLMLQYRPRPMIITPPEPPAERSVLIAYDGTPGASRAAQYLVLMGLASGREVHVLSADRKKQVARTRTESIADYLSKHGVEATQHPVEGRADPRDLIIEKLKETEASLLVAGAFGASNWRRNMFGSVSDHLVRWCPVPLLACQ